MSGDIEEAVRQLSQLGDAHWFCPRTPADEYACYFDEDIPPSQRSTETPEEKQKRQSIIDKFEARKPLFFKALLIFAYDGGDSARLLNLVKFHIEKSMQNCDVCVRQYHKLRPEIKQELEAEHDADDVMVFMNRFDDYNNDRIKNNLVHATNMLNRLPEAERSLANLDDVSVYSFFEAISSTEFSASEALVQDHFDEPFDLVRGHKRLTVQTYLPGATQFLFSNKPERRQWAEKMWRKYSYKPSRKEFQWTSRDPLLTAMFRVQKSALDIPFLPIFWSGMKSIVTNLDNDLITHSLQELDINIFLLILDHMHTSFPGFGNLLFVFNKILELAPAAFWDSMRAINPPTVIEQVFASPNLRSILEDGEQVALEGAFQWQQPFLKSLSAANTPMACRSLVRHFMSLRGDQTLPQQTRLYFFDSALFAMMISLRSLESVTRRVDPACTGEMLQVVNEHASDIVPKAKGLKNTTSAQLSFPIQVIKSAISLEASLIESAYHTITTGGRLSPHHLSVLDSGLWKRIPDSLRPTDVALATYSLIGARKLALVEKIASKNHPLSESAVQLNITIEKCTGYVVSILDRVNDFEIDDIASIFRSSEMASGLLTTLFFADENARVAGLEVLKTLNTEGDPTRRDALRALLKAFFAPTLSALANSIPDIQAARNYRPLRAVITIGRDLVDALFNSQDGVIRSREMTAAECEATEQIWTALWQALTTIFNNTERWSVHHDRLDLQEFCRDVMEFADDYYEFYTVIVGAITEDDATRKAKVTKSLLRSPSETMASMVKWLRLRDDYLVTKITKLVSDLLVKLRGASLKISTEAQVALEGVVTRKTRTKLSNGQIANLSQALDKHLGTISAPEAVEVKSRFTKQSQITSFIKDSGVAAVKRESASRYSDSDSASDSMSKLLNDNTKGAQKFAALKAAGKFGSRTADTIGKKSAAVEAFIKKRQAEKEALLKAKQDRAKQLRGLGEAGSGLGGMRVIGKDHNIKGDLMTSSESSSASEDEDEFDRELFGSPVKNQKGSIKAGGPEIKMIKEMPKVAVKLRRQIRSARDMKARVAPDLSPLHKAILSWDYFYSGDYPPGSSSDDYRKLPSTFTDPGHYKNLFLPLLLLEAWQSFVKAKEESSAKPFEIKIANRSNVDSFIEVSTLMAHTDSREVFDGDVVLLSCSKAAREHEDSCLARVHKTQRKKQGMEITYRLISGSPMHKHLNPESVMWGTKVQSLTPLEREYGALQGLQYYDLCDYILKAQPSNLLPYKDQQIDPLAKTYELNRAQARAVKSAIDNDAFTLIQGPPGSGKTKTITAIVGALLTDSIRNALSGTRISTPGVSTTTQVQSSRKLLICAPSNAAVDELVMRLKKGIKTLSGQTQKINVVRLGRSDAINVAVQDVTLDELINARLNANSDNSDSRQETQRLMKEHKEISEKLRDARIRLDTEGTKAAKDEFEALRRSKALLGTRIDKSKEKESQTSRQADLERKRVQQAILDSAHVICATLSGSGHEMFQNLNIEFETVVVDEAAQCVEASALIPLKYGCAKCILVGDPKQLPPTVLSKEATRFQYEQSLFVRMQNNFPNEVHLLDTQYRMHPAISQFPSTTFYDGKLLDGPSMADLRIKPWHNTSLLGPYRFFDVQGQHQAAVRGHSLVNYAEIEVCLKLYDRVTTDFSSFDFRSKIGIITPYKSQLAELKARFKREYGQSIFDNVEFNTTDAFQGRESEIIIFSCVRASPAGNIGFLQDIRRMNVGLTRAKSSLWVLGNSDSLMRGEYWRKLVEDAKSRQLFSSGNYIDQLMRPTPANQRSQPPSAPKHVQKPTPAVQQSPTIPPKSMALGNNRPMPPVERVMKVAETRSSSASVPQDTGAMDLDEILGFSSSTKQDAAPTPSLFPSKNRPPVSGPRKRQAADPFLQLKKRDKKPRP